MSKNPACASTNIPTRLESRVKQAGHVNIRYSPPKANLMHFIPFSSNKSTQRNRGVTLDGQTIAAQDSMKVLGVWIDHRLSLHTHSAAANSRTRTGCGMFNSISNRKGASPGALHNLAKTITIPRILWGSGIWWTGAGQILKQLGPAYHSNAGCNTGLPKWTPLPNLLREAGLPSLKSLLD